MTTKLRGFVPVILALAFCAATQSARAQGQVNFANGTSNRVVNCLTGTFVTNGSAFRAALYYAPAGVTDEASFVQAGASTTFTSPGIFNGGTRTLPNAPGTAFNIQIRVWEAAYGATWEGAVASGPINCRWPLLGKSAIVTVITTAAPDPPATIPFPSFTICPNACVSVTCSSNILVITTNPAGAAVTYSVSSTNVCCPTSTNTVLNCSPPSGSVFPQGTNVVNCTISDGIGPSNSCFFLVVVRVPSTRYVSLTGSHTFPYTNWAGAATNIQAAVNAANDSDTVLVTNGTYRVRTNVFVAKAINVRSVNGAGVTSIDAQFTNRCVFASNTLAVIDGFTIKNGRAMQTSDDPGDGGGVYLVGGIVQNCIVSNCIADAFAARRGGGVYMIGGILTNSSIINNGSGLGQHNGGGVYCVSTGRIEQCQIRGNSTEYWGGGVYIADGVLTRSWISDNASGDFGGGVYALRSSVTDRCIISNNVVSGQFSFGPDGGGIYLGGGELDRSIVVSNTAGTTVGNGGHGGGVYTTNGVVRNSLIVGNRSRTLSSPGYGGGVYLKSASLWNSTVSGNVSEQSGAVYVETYGTVTNTISYYNSGATNVNWAGVPATFDHVCTTPDPGGSQNITSPPLFVNTNALNYRLAAGSPCIDKGVNQAWMASAQDLDGSPRIINTTVDVGVFESLCVGPAIVQQPISQTNCASSTALFSVSASGSPPTYQWQFNGTNLVDGPHINGANSTNLAIFNVTLSDAGNYRALINNSCGAATSFVASLTVRILPSIGLNPVSQTNCTGEAVTFRATATGSAPLTVRWQKDGVDLLNDAHLSGATTTNLAMTGLLAADGGNYSLIASNSCGTATSTVAVLTVRTPPSIPNPFVSFKTNVGATLAFTITPGGSTPRSVQWRFNGVNMVDGGRILGSRTTVLTIANAQPSDSGTYSVIVSNACASVTNDMAAVIVANCPLFTLQPTNATQCMGSTVSFRIAISGTPPFSLLWRHDGSPITDDGRITGSSTTNLVIHDLQVLDGGTYDVVVSNACGTATSIPVNLVVLTPPEFKLQPASQVTYEGATVTFSSSADSLLPNYYQWRFNGISLPSQTNPALTLSNVTKADAGDYTVVVSNSCGAVTSAVATLAVPDCLSIAANPVSQDVNLDAGVTFSVTPSGAAPFGYQWRFNGAPLSDGALISGSTGPQLHISTAESNHVGSYAVIVSNFCGSVTSAPASLTLKAQFVAETAPPSLGDLRLSSAGVLKAVIVQPDGRIIVGGFFTSINEVPRNGLARLNPDGTVDATWDPKVQRADYGEPLSGVEAMVLNGTDLFVGGNFTRIGGQARNGLAKLSILNNGAADPSWNPNISALETVRALAVFGTNVFVGGQFDGVGGVARRNLAKVNASGLGAVDVVWNADVDGWYVSALAVSGSQLYVGGTFASLRGQVRTNLARVALTGGGVVDASWDPQPDGPVKALAAAGSDLFVGGSFSTIAGQDRGGIAKFQLGSLDPQWNPVTLGPVYSLAVRGTNLFAGASPPGLVRFRTTGTGTRDLSWNPALLSDAASATIYAMAVTDTGVFAGGVLTDAGSAASAGIVKLSPLNGARVPNFTVHLQSPGTVFAIARQDNGKVIIGGDFMFAAGLVRRNLARLNVDGTVDGAWLPSAYGPVQAISLSGTSAFVGGWFGRIGTNDQPYLAKVDIGGSDAIDPAWKPRLDGPVFSLLTAGSNLFAGGQFQVVNEFPRQGICKLIGVGNGTLDTTWDVGLGPGDYGYVYAMQSDGDNLYLGGAFTELRGSLIYNLARVTASGTGTVDTAWHPNPAGDVLALALAGTNLYFGGNFTDVDEQLRSGVARVNLNGALDTWAPDADGTVSALAIVGDDLYVGGGFHSIGGEARSFLAKVSGSGAGDLDPNWKHEGTYAPDLFKVYEPGVKALLANGEDVYVGGHFTDVDGVRRVGYVFLPIPDAPTMFVTTNSTIIIQRNAADGPEITGFRITDIVGGDLFHGDGTTRINEGEWVTVAEGANGLTFVGTNGEPQTVSAVSAFNQTAEGTGTASQTVDVSVGGLPAFSFSRVSYEVVENVDPALVEVTVVKRNPGAASVSFVWIPVTAQPYRYHDGDFAMLGNVTTFNFGANQTSTNIEFFIFNDDLREGDEQFVVSLVSSSAGSVIVEPRDAVVTILDDECTGDQGPSMLTQVPTPLPPLNAALKLTLQPPSGQWRLAGDPVWRASGETASGLSGGIYEVGFRPLTAGELLGNMFFEVNEGETAEPPDIQYPGRSALESGTLEVDIVPPEVAPLALWQPAGYPQSFASGATASLQAGTYELHFSPVPGWNPPTDLFATVAPGSDSLIVARFTPVETVSNQKPQPLTISQVLNEAPYYYNGLIETEVPSEGGTQVRFGSGVVVKQRVVLTAAHVLFDEVNFTFVTQARWYLQKHRGEYEPRPQLPQGWYIRAGYDAQRRAEATATSGGAASRSLDVAAMFFEGADNLPGRGGFGGFVASDNDGHEWLVSTREKMLVGYPLDPSAPTNHGKMHATLKVTSPFQLIQRRVYANADLQSFPGNSGGPLYVKADNGAFFPAAVYLGGSGQAVVRSIDKDVVCLINSAEQTGSGGGHHVGGGVDLWEIGDTSKIFTPGLFGVIIEPPAVTNLARWHVVRSATDTSADFTSGALIYPTEPGEFAVAFKQIEGWGTPTNRLGIAYKNQINRITAQYVPLVLKYAVITNTARQIVDIQWFVQGAPGRRYNIHMSTDLPNWVGMTSVTNEEDGTVRFLEPLPRVQQRFFRAKEPRDP